MPGLNPSLAGQRPNPMFRIAALVHGRRDVIHLEFGEPDFATPPHIVAAAHRSLTDERQGYGPGNGIVSLREAIAARAARVNHLAVTPDEVVVTAGGTGALMAAFLTLCAPGDEALLPDPAWAGYDAMLAASGVRRTRYPLAVERDWLPDLEALEAAITPRTKLLLVNSPANPTGAVFPRAIVAALVGIARRHNLWILSDECYDEILFEGEHVSPAALDTDGRVVTVGTCSKSYAMTGWRVGWAVCPPRAATAIGLVVGAQVNNLPLFAQRAAEAALTGPQDDVGDMVASYRRRRDLTADILRAHRLLDTIPAGAFYALVPVTRLAGITDHEPFDGVAFAERLIEAEHVAVGPGIAYGPIAARHMRVSLASADDDLRAGLHGLLRFAASYRASSG